MNQTLIDQIDAMTYEQLFTTWRFSKSGHPLFQGDVGEHYKKVFFEKRKQVGDAEHTRISKKIGW